MTKEKVSKCEFWNVNLAKTSTNFWTTFFIMDKPVKFWAAICGPLIAMFCNRNCLLQLKVITLILGSF